MMSKTEQQARDAWFQQIEAQRSAASAAIDGVVARVTQRIAELPDRSSPADWPEAMLVTADELAVILREELEAAAHLAKPKEAS